VRTAAALASPAARSVQSTLFNLTCPFPQQGASHRTVVAALWWATVHNISSSSTHLNDTNESLGGWLPRTPADSSKAAGERTQHSSGVSLSCCSSLTGRCSRGTAASIRLRPACSRRAARTISCRCRTGRAGRCNWRCAGSCHSAPVLLLLLLPLLPALCC
jgi:hypothetical protein